MHQPVKSSSGPHALQHPPPASHATQCSLRDRKNSLHPLKQNPPSLAEVDIAAFDDVDITCPEPIRAPPSALTSTAYDPHSDLSSPLENYPLPHNGHQRSLTGSFFDNCQPFINRATSSLQQHTSRASFHAPTKSLASFIPSRSAIESTASQPKIRAGAKALQNWFNGASNQIQLGIGAREESDDEYEHEHDDYDSEEDDEDEGNMMAGIFNRGPAFTRPSEPPQQTQGPAPNKPHEHQSTPASRFAWLLSTQKNSAIPPPVPSPTYHNPSDELLNLNISQALFPHGPADPLAPSSFNDLLSNAESLLSRFQTSYRQLSTALVDARAEQSAQDDELDEAETRVRHLKSQLETMAARASEQDEQMRRLMEELMFERRARQEEEAARKRSLALVKGHATREQAECHSPGPEIPRRRNRVSNSDVSVDSGFESECETDTGSIFSRTNCMSPTGTDLSSVAESDDRDVTPKSKKPQATQRRSTYDKVRDGAVDLEKGGWGCSNCEGGSQASVWGRLAREREENSVLRRRVGELEEAVEGALNVVDGPWGI